MAKCILSKIVKVGVVHIAMTVYLFGYFFHSLKTRCGTSSWLVMLALTLYPINWFLNLFNVDSTSTFSVLGKLDLGNQR